MPATNNDDNDENDDDDGDDYDDGDEDDDDDDEKKQHSLMKQDLLWTSKAKKMLRTALQKRKQAHTHNYSKKKRRTPRAQHSHRKIEIDL
jgi:hypothetical protein